MIPAGVGRCQFILLSIFAERAGLLRRKCASIWQTFEGQTREDGLLGPERILIIRLSAIGDVVMASPLIRALRLRYPGARIAWLAQPETASLLICHPELDEVITWPRGQWRQWWQERRYADLFRAVRDFRQLLRQRRFDLVLDLQGLLKSGLLAWMTGARRRIGLGSREGSQWLMHEVVDREGGPKERIGSEYLFLAWSLGLPADDFRMEIGIGPDAENNARKLREGGFGNSTYGVVCPFTTRPQKHWIADNWERLILRLREEIGVPVAILGGPGDRGQAEAMASASGALNLAGSTDLQTAAALIRGASYLIGVDTGLTHMGIAFGRPTLCLFGSTRPYTDTAVPGSRVIYHEMPCAPCRRRPTCDGRFDCMRAITVEEVLAALSEVMEEGDES